MTRTHDLLITNQLLYRLSYTSTGVFSANESIAQSRAIVKLQFRKEALETKKQILQQKITIRNHMF